MIGNNIIKDAMTKTDGITSSKAIYRGYKTCAKTRV